MSEQIYKEFFEESLNQIHAEYSNSGKESDFKFWFNIEYVEDNFDSITVSVASEFMWKQMEKKGSVEKIQHKINELTGQSITINHIVSSKTVQIKKTENEVSQKTQINTAEKEEISEPTYQKSEETFKPKFFDIEKMASEAPEKIYKPEISEPQKKTASAPAVFTKPEKHNQLSEDYTFENFVPGDNSQYAYSASLAAAKNPGDKRYNPIFLYGGSGLGKTHLMESIGNYIYQNNPEANICYISTESLMNEFTSSIREKTSDKFIKKYRKLDVLLLDDIQFLEKSEALQNELFYMFNEIYEKKGQLVFTCDRPISEVKKIEERLRTRFSRGLNIDIQPPDYETRHAILEKKLSLTNKNIPEDVIDYIAKNVQSNVRELEACLTKMIGYAELIEKDLTIQIAQDQLRDTISNTDSEEITVEKIQKIICDHYKLTLAELKGSKRDRKIVQPRQIAIYLSRELTQYSFPELGNEFGGKDHTTIMHSYKIIQEQLKTDPTLLSTLKALERQIKESKI